MAVLALSSVGEGVAGCDEARVEEAWKGATTCTGRPGEAARPGRS